MARQDLAKRAADRLGQLERLVRGRRATLWSAGAIAAVSVAGHAVFDAPALAWASAVAAAVAALAVGQPAVWLALGAAVGHAGADAVLGADVWFGTALLRTTGMAAAATTAAGTGVLLGRYEEARRRSRDEDAVTGLLNVRAFYDGLHALRDAGRSYAILVADIAGMRNLNERYGHPTGTEAMRALGYVLQHSTKRTDLVARLGSDEVAVALVGADQQGALAAARRLSRLLQDEVVTLPDGSRFRVHAYYGIATSADLPDEVALLRAADHAVAAAKTQGLDEIALVHDAQVTYAHPPGGTGLAPA